MTTTSTAGGGRREWIVVAVVLLLGVLALLKVDHRLSILIPAAVVAVPLIVYHGLKRPITLLTLFLLVAVNLDFVKLGGGLSLDVAASMMLLALFLVVLGLQPAGSASPVLDRLFLVFLAAVLASVVVSVMPAHSVKRLGRELQYAVVVAVLLRSHITPARARMVLGAMLLASIVPSALALLGYAFHIDAFLGQEIFFDSLYQGEARARATLSHPSTLASFLMVTLSVTVVLILSRRLFPLRFTLPLAVLQAAAMFVSYGRAGWIGFMAAGATALWIRGQRRLLLLGVPVVLYALYRVVPTFQQRVLTATTDSENNSLLWRLGLWAFALEKYPERPIFGSGIGTFLEYVDYLQGFNPHQTWIGLLVETGMVGFLAFLGLTVGVGVLLHRALRRCTGDTLIVVQCAFVAWVGMMVSSLGANNFARPSVLIYFWVLVGTALALTRGKSSSLREDATDSRSPTA